MEWSSVKEKLPEVNTGKFRIRRANGCEMEAFFYADQVMWISWYGQKTSHWWNAKGDHERLDDVTHWKENEGSNK